MTIRNSYLRRAGTMKDPRRDKDKRAGLARRDFLKTAGLGVAAGLGAATLGAGTAAGEAVHASADHRRGRYRESEHVRRVYELARF
jgi:hypothetical protein